MYYRSGNTEYWLKMMMFYDQGKKAFLALAMIPLLLASSLAQPMRSKDTIFMFGNWRIDIIKENRSLQLVGMVTEGKGAFFSLQCYAEGDQLTIFVPTLDTDEVAAARRRGFVQVTVWNDQSAPITVPMTSMKGAAGIAIADKHKLPDPFTISAFNFIGKLREARAFFALETGGPTRTYDAKHLNAARGKFEQSCAEIRKDWADFINRL